MAATISWPEGILDTIREETLEEAGTEAAKRRTGMMAKTGQSLPREVFTGAPIRGITRWFSSKQTPHRRVFRKRIAAFAVAAARCQRRRIKLEVPSASAAPQGCSAAAPSAAPAEGSSRIEVNAAMASSIRSPTSGRLRRERPLRYCVTACQPNPIPMSAVDACSSAWSEN